MRFAAAVAAGAVAGFTVAYRGPFGTHYYRRGYTTAVKQIGVTP